MDIDRQPTLAEQVADLERATEALKRYNGQYSDLFVDICKALGIKDRDYTQIVPKIEQLQLAKNGDHHGTH